MRVAVHLQVARLGPDNPPSYVSTHLCPAGQSKSLEQDFGPSWYVVEQAETARSKAIKMRRRNTVHLQFTEGAP
ncbi:hypothetical protein ACFL5T_03025 [Gemmatimonadota bacterium]